MARLAAVTGATGFLGSHIVSALASAGWRIRILARRASDQRQLAGRAFETVSGELLDRRALDALVDGADAVIHAAGLVKAANAAEFRRVNAGGTANLVAALNDARSSKRMILVSSMAAREPALSPYAATKRESEAALAALSRSTWSIIRPCAVYGPWDRAMLAIFRAARHGLFPTAGPRNGRVALIHAADAAEAIVSLCGEDLSTQTFELTDHRVDGYRWGEVAAALETAIGAKVLRLSLPSSIVRAAAAANMIGARLSGRTPIFTLAKVREILHADWGSIPERQIPQDIWRPKIALGDGFRDTVSWYRDQGWLPAETSGPRFAGVVR